MLGSRHFLGQLHDWRYLILGTAVIVRYNTAPREKTALQLLPSQGKRLLIRSAGLQNPSQPATQIRAGRVREVIIGEFLARMIVGVFSSSELGLALDDLEA